MPALVLSLSAGQVELKNVVTNKHLKPLVLTMILVCSRIQKSLGDYTDPNLLHDSCTVPWKRCFLTAPCIFISEVVRL